MIITELRIRTNGFLKKRSECKAEIICCHYAHLKKLYVLGGDLAHFHSILLYPGN